MKEMVEPIKRIEVSDLRLAYGEREVIKALSFDVYANEILAIIGPLIVLALVGFLSAVAFARYMALGADR